MISNLADGIGSSHSLHKPKSGVSILVNARSNFDRVFLAFAKAASLILLRFCFSMRLAHGTLAFSYLFHHPQPGFFVVGRDFAAIVIVKRHVEILDVE